jgi:Ca-activated chloride channel homolog
MKAPAVRVTLLPALACAILAIVSVSAQQPIRSGVRTVAVYTTVTDAEGRLVPDLTQDDFEIYEDGKLRPIAVFASEIQPITAIVMLDRSGSMKLNLPFVDRATEAFVRRLLPADKIRIGSFGERIKIHPEGFTSDKTELIRIIRTELQSEGPSPVWNSINESIKSLKEQDGRRVVLVFTDGHDNPGPFAFNNATFMDVMNRGQREDVMVYAIGLESRMPIHGGMSVRAMMPDRPDPGLPTIAAETGGGYFELKRADDLEATFTRVAEELHRQYALGFEPAKLDGKRHKLEVKIRKPGMTARARKSYVAAKD